MDAAGLAEALSDLLKGMSPRTRRPIRFLEPEATQRMPLDDGSVLDGTDSELPRGSDSAAASQVQSKL